MNTKDGLVKDKETGTIFDDWVSNDLKESDTDTWTQVCDDCAKKHHLLDSYLEIGVGQGTCGVKGCLRAADHNYDFNRISAPISSRPAKRSNRQTKTKPSSLSGMNR